MWAHAYACDITTCDLMWSWNNHAHVVLPHLSILVSKYKKQLKRTSKRLWKHCINKLFKETESYAVPWRWRTLPQWVLLSRRNQMTPQMLRFNENKENKTTARKMFQTLFSQHLMALSLFITTFTLYISFFFLWSIFILLLGINTLQGPNTGGKKELYI
jgi:hypothetical protein